MVAHTDSVAFIWQIAAGEAAWQKHEFIEKEHIFIALCKAHEFLQEEVLKQIGIDLPPEGLREMKRELSLLVSAFKTCNLNPRYLRRRVRALLGEGNYERKENEIIHRSEKCKTCFKKAEDLAGEEGIAFLYPLHILKALLLEPGPHIERALKDLGTTPQRLVESTQEEVKEPEEERKEEGAPAGPREEPLPPPPKSPKRDTPFLDRFERDLTDLAAKGRLKPIVGRKKELLEGIRTLLRKEKNNPLLIGEAGVGKTAIVEGLAQRIVSRNIEPRLWGKRIVEIKLASVVAGTTLRGEFEERLLGVLDEAKAHPEVILFLDEVHTMVGAGTAAGGLNAADILKPVLGRGEIKVIGATTIEEYRHYIEKDSALERRFQPIMVEEPTPAETLEILQGIKGDYERHHGVSIPPETLMAAVDLSVRYLPYRRLPDKAIDVLDRACAAVRVPAVSYHGDPEYPEEGTDEPGDLRKVRKPQVAVTAETLAEVVAGETGIPVGRITQEEGQRLLRLADRLKERVIGQDEAVEKVAQAIKRARAGLKGPRRPVGVFLFLGPTGVGKTELARAMAEDLFGSEDHMIRLDMSEYMEKHGVARLIGAPPGYVGHEEGGQLTEKLRRRPYSLVLLDEMEKAHPEVFDSFLQLFDDGRLTDGQGRMVDARNSIFVMTSNIGTELYYKEPIGFVDPDSENGRDIKKEIETKLRGTFRPEFLNRIDEVISFRPLKMEDMKSVVLKMLEPLSAQLDQKGIFLTVKDEALELLVQKGYEPLYGARALERIIRQLVETPLSEKILAEECSSGQRVVVDASGEEIIIKAEYGTA